MFKICSCIYNNIVKIALSRANTLHSIIDWQSMVCHYKNKPWASFGSYALAFHIWLLNTTLLYQTLICDSGKMLRYGLFSVL